MKPSTKGKQFVRIKIIPELNTLQNIKDFIKKEEQAFKAATGIMVLSGFINPFYNEEDIESIDIVINRKL